ncbi:hypothetical protein [Sphingobium chungbukense]|uniref:Uncharacterized protein n=1 Tax=Sphingobium chungbukense TaxID=56193 RepID=A0A0M3AHU1_9SPHN|nr:hypothetical protein [Sphingobium chungbukense]KKW89405.1 hypothetical protein YP76_25340 [Sphingobium chungbukense]
MASNPWAILSSINDGPSIADLYVGAKQRRIADLMQARKMRQEDEDRAWAIEERQAIADAATPAPVQASAPSIPVDGKRSASAQFGRLSQLSGVRATPEPQRGTLAQLALAPPSEPQAHTIDPYGRKVMIASMGEQGYNQWRKRHGIVEIGDGAPSPPPPMPAAPPVSDPAIPTTPSVADEPQHTAEAESLIPADAGLEPPVSGATSPIGGLSLNPAGLRRLQRINPKLAFSLAEMEADQRTAAYKAITEQVALESRVIGAVRAAPEADQQRVYSEIRNYLGSRGVTGLPEQWDPALAETHQRMGMTAMQAFNDERADQRLAHDIADDEADNARADRNTDSLIADRNARRGLVARGQDLTDARGRRGQDLASSDRQRGQNMASSDRRYAVDNGGRRKKAGVPENIPTIRSAADRDKLPKGALYRAPDGSINRKN